MPTSHQTVKTWIDNALLQVGAESYLHGEILGNRAELIRRLKFGFNDPTHPFIVERATADSDTSAIQGGAYNRMVETQAISVVDRYEIIDHHANDQTGFSATLYKDRTTGSTPGQ